MVTVFVGSEASESGSGEPRSVQVEASETAGEAARTMESQLTSKY